MQAAALKRLNDRADRVDDVARRDVARKAADTARLRAACAPRRAIFDLAEPPEPLPVVGLSVLACAVLALVRHFQALGHGGLQAARKDLAWLFSCSDSSVKRALAELREGWLIVTPDYVPAEESALGFRYVGARRGPFRCVPAANDDDDAHANSRVPNLYRLGSKAHAWRCGQVGEKTSDPADEPAIVSALISGSGSSVGSGSISVVGPVGLWKTATVEPEIEGSASSPRSTLPPNERDGDSLLAAAHFVDASAPLVADPRVDVDQVGDGDGSEAVMEGAPRRGLFATMGHGLARFLRGGDA